MSVSEIAVAALEILVFSKVADNAYHHASIPDGIQAIHEIGAGRAWNVHDTVDARRFNSASLSRFDVIVWNNTGGDILDGEQRSAFESFIHHGGGYVGIHEAAPGAGLQGVDWPWYEKLVGAHFERHPAGTPEGRIIVTPERHPATELLPHPWIRSDEWYEWDRDPSANPTIHILLTADERSYGGGDGTHPLSWYHEFEGGRSFYTALGHPPAGFKDPHFRDHLTGAIEWASAHSPNLRNNAAPGAPLKMRRAAMETSAMRASYTRTRSSGTRPRTAWREARLPCVLPSVTTETPTLHPSRSTHPMPGACTT